MKILFHHRIASRDGQAVHIEELIEALTAQGHETLLVGPSGFTRTGFGGSSPTIDRIKASIPPALYELMEIAYSVPAFFRLRKAARAFKPDFIYERFSLFLFAGIVLRRLTRIPVLLEVNSPLFEERAKNDGLKLHRIGRWAQRTIWRSVDVVLPVTHVLAATIRDDGIPPERIEVIPNGINPGRFSNAPDHAAAKTAIGLPHAIVLGFTGFIRGWNAAHRVIDFVAENAATYDLHYRVVGDGPAKPAILAHAAEKHVADRLTITGVVARDAVASQVAAFDIALLPALTAYSSPLKLFEYMYLGCAIVAPDTDNIREILTDGHDAILFDPNRPGAMESAIRLLCEDPALRSRIGRQARATIDDKSLTWHHNAERVTALARAVLRRTAPRSPP